MTLNIAGDYKFEDGVETMTFAQGQHAPVSVKYCLRSNLTMREVALGASFGVQPTDMGLDVSALEFPTGVTPRLGNVFTDANNVSYTVQAILNYDQIVKIYRLAVRQALVSGPSN